VQTAKRGRALPYLIVAAFLGVVPSSFAAQTANMSLTGVGTNGTLGGVYIGPYVGTVNGVTTPLICDDFIDESYIPETWTADVYSISDYASLRFHSSTAPLAQVGYEEVAWLSQQLTNQSLGLPTTCTNTTSINCAGDIQYAIWAVFDPTALTYITGANRTNANTWLSAAQSHYSTGDYSNVSVYTAVAGTALCGGRACPPGPTPQEFIVVRTPEPPFLSLLGVDLSAVGGLIFFLKRKVITA